MAKALSKILPWETLSLRATDLTWDFAQVLDSTLRLVWVVGKLH